MGKIPEGPTAKALQKFGLTVRGTARELGLEVPRSLNRFFNHEQFDRYLGKEKRERLRQLLRNRRGQPLSKQKFAQFVNSVRAEHAAIRSAAIK